MIYTSDRLTDLYVIWYLGQNLTLAYIEITPAEGLVFTHPMIFFFYNFALKFLRSQFIKENTVFNNPVLPHISA